MNKELELEAEKEFPISLEDFGDEKIDGNAYFRDIWKNGATSKYVEKQKLEFAIEQLRKCTHAPTIRVGVVLEELEQKLSEL